MISYHMCQLINSNSHLCFKSEVNINAFVETFCLEMGHYLFSLNFIVPKYKDFYFLKHSVFFLFTLPRHP